MDRAAPPVARVFRVFLVDGRELLRLGVAALLEVQQDLEVVGEAGRAADVLPRVCATRPDVVLLGEFPPEFGVDGGGSGRLGAGGASGAAPAVTSAATGAGAGARAGAATAADSSIAADATTVADPSTAAAAELCRALRAEPDPPVCLLLSAVLDVRTLTAAERAGAAGCVPEDVHGGELVAALHRLAAGEPLHAGRTEPLPMPAAPPAPPKPPDPLTGLSPTDREIVALIGEGLTNRQIGTRLGLSERTVKNHVSRVLAALDMERRTQIAALASRLGLPDPTGPA
jgi:DNA-binding NarL/FixJ family response regulator